MLIGRNPDYMDFSLPPLTITGVRSFTHFQAMVWGDYIPSDPMLLATLLYTESDIELAKYVREHFDELHIMSGPRVITYVVENSGQKRNLAIPSYWKTQLDMLIYNAWTLIGWISSKPYDKNSAYEIARSLGIYPDQLPCLAVFDRTEQVEKIVFPVNGDFTNFFRNTFSNIQRALDNMGPGPDIYDKDKLNNERLKLFNKLRESLTIAQTDGDDQRVVYHFYDQVVFINKPSGTTIIKDFQKGKKQ